MRQMIDPTPDNLSAMHCTPLEKNASALTEQDEHIYISAVPHWQVHPETPHKLWREIELKNFKSVLTLVNKMGEIAEEEQHHPDFFVHSYKFLRIELSTHEVNGLSLNDFILAAKINTLLTENKDIISS